MNRAELMENLENATIDDEGADASRRGNGEAMQMAVAKIREKKTKTGRIRGLRKGINTESDEGLDRHGRLTPQQHLFVQGILAGKTKLQAYRDAYKTKGADSVVSVAANKVLKSKNVAAVLLEFDDTLKEKILEDAMRTRRWIMERLHERVVSAKSEGSELKALELMGRAVAMFSDNVTQTVKNVDVSQLKQELKSHLSLLDGLKKAG